jgi:hypothetical protein
VSGTLARMRPTRATGRARSAMSRVVREALHRCRPPLQRANHLFPHRLAEAPRAVPATLYCVYRARNAGRVGALVTALGPDVAVHLHALDSPAAELEHLTRAGGHGSRMQLLQRLIDSHPPRAGDYAVVADDDVTLLRARTGTFLEFVAAAGFDFAQPAHAGGSIYTYSHLVVKPWCTARCVDFVEVGPLVALSPAAQAWALPFPAEAGMGWGVDVDWWALARRHDLRQGVVDATPLLHHGAIGADYSRSAESDALGQRLQAHGLTSVLDIARTCEPRWRPPRRSPPWAVST